MDSSERLIVTPERRERYVAMRNAGQIEELETELDLTKRDLGGIVKILSTGMHLGPQHAAAITEEHGLRAEFEKAVIRTKVDLLDLVARLIEGRPTQGQPNSKEKVQGILRKLHTLLFNRVQCLQSKVLEAQVAKVLASPEDDPFSQVDNFVDSYVRPVFDDFIEILELAEVPESTNAAVNDFMHEGIREGKTIESKLQFDETTVFFTTPHVTESKHIEVLMFILHRGRLYPRVAYKSISGIAWKVNLYPVKWMSRYEKGEFYVQGNKPTVEIEQMLYALESKMNKEWPLEGSKIGFENGKDIHTSSKEIKAPEFIPEGLEKVARFGAPYCWGHKERGKRGKKGELDETMFDSIPEEFIPDFTGGPLKVLNRLGTFEDQGQVRLELYENKYRGSTYRFWMAFDEQGRVWVERLYRHPMKITSYGTQEEAFDWAICSKPFEYCDYPNQQTGDLRVIDKEEANQLQENHGGFTERNLAIQVESAPHYADITPTLDQFNLIQKFREERGIKRKPLIQFQGKDEAGSLNISGYSISPEKMLENEHLIQTPELEDLLKVMDQGNKVEIGNKIIQILKRPGTRPSITLRGLRRLFFECYSDFEEQNVVEALEAIIEQFQQGFPREKSLYVAIYQDLLKLYGIDQTWQSERMRRRMGRRIMTVNSEAAGSPRRNDPKVDEWLKIMETAPEIVRYANRLKLLSAVCQVDEQYSTDPNEMRG